MLALKRAVSRNCSLIRSPKLLYLYHRLHSPWHWLNQWSIAMLRKTTSLQAPDIRGQRASLFLGRTGQVACIVLFTSLYIFLMEFILGAHGEQSMTLTTACIDSHSWTTWKLFLSVIFKIVWLNVRSLCSLQPTRTEFDMPGLSHVWTWTIYNRMPAIKKLQKKSQKYLHSLI